MLFVISHRCAGSGDLGIIGGRWKSGLDHSKPDLGRGLFVYWAPCWHWFWTVGGNKRTARPQQHQTGNKPSPKWRHYGGQNVKLKSRWIWVGLLSKDKMHSESYCHDLLINNKCLIIFHQNGKTRTASEMTFNEILFKWHRQGRKINNVKYDLIRHSCRLKNLALMQHFNVG